MSEGLFRWTGTLARLTLEDHRQLRERQQGEDPALQSRTAEIVARVRREGDAALRVMAREFDSVELGTLEVPRVRWAEAFNEMNPDLRRALMRARDNLSKVSAAFRPQLVEIESEPGVRVGRRPDPLARVGVYAPGGRATYPSSVLMGAVPAKVAGVAEIILCSPPTSSGYPTKSVLAAAQIARVDRVFAVGGAGAVAAMAYGTQTIPRVDRIVGPGNAYVAEAKRQVAQWVGIDAPAGPSEILIIADATADPDAVARELLAQAEHDSHAVVIALTLGPSLATRIEQSAERQLSGAPREEIMRQALGGRSALLSVETLDEAVAFSNEFAPEHLLLALQEPSSVLPHLRHVGTVFLGPSSSVAFGDYLTGSNHVLPTGGFARSYSGLSTQDFVRWTSYQEVSPSAAANLARDVEVLAEAEGLFAHAVAARAWRKSWP